MKQLRSSRHLVRMRHRREKGTIGHLVEAAGDQKGGASTRHSAFTASGLSVEAQVRKAWQPCVAGLAIF